MMASAPGFEPGIGVIMTTTDEVLELRRKGMRNKEIAEALDLTKSTVNYHIEKLRFAGLAEQRISPDDTIDWAAVQLDLDKLTSRAEILKQHDISHSAMERAVAVNRVTIKQTYAKDMT